MTSVGAAPISAHPTVPQAVSVVILGTDALLAASPATPVQLAHACLRAGFANVIPASWGDELIAAAVLRRLPTFGVGPAIQCSCPIVAHRLLTVGGDLRPALLALVPPPVAASRYVRAVSQAPYMRITYAGACPGAVDDSIDVRMTPEALIALLAERQIVLNEQPRMFESVIPADRRRFWSQPGGLPAADALWAEAGSRTLVELDGDDLVTDLAQLLLGGQNVLIDVSTHLGCVCSGAVLGTMPKDARAGVVTLEPPRATTVVVEDDVPIDLDLVLPAAPRTPIDVLAIPHAPTPPRPWLSSESAPASNRRSTPMRGVSVISEPRQTRIPSPVNPRPVLGTLPVVRDLDGKSLPRAYIARRRSSPKGIPVVVPTESVPSTIPVASDAPPIAEPHAPPRTSQVHTSFSPSLLTSRSVLLALVAIFLLALSISAVVAVAVEWSLR